MPALMTTPVLLLPGLDATGRLYGAISAALPERYPLRPLSYPSDAALDYDGLLPLVRAAVPADSRFVLVGESFSGPLAIRLAAEKPPGLVALVLCATFARTPLPVPVWSISSAMFRLRAPKWVMRMLMFDAEVPSNELDEFMAAIGSVEARVMATRARAAVSVDVREQLAAVEVPVLYLRAGADRLFGPSVHDVVHRLRPDARVVTFDGAPHLLLQRRARDVATVMCGWLDEHLGPS